MAVTFTSFTTPGVSGSTPVRRSAAGSCSTRTRPLSKSQGLGVISIRSTITEISSATPVRQLPAGGKSTVTQLRYPSWLVATTSTNSIMMEASGGTLSSNRGCTLRDYGASRKRSDNKLDSLGVLGLKACSSPQLLVRVSLIKSRLYNQTDSLTLRRMAVARMKENTPLSDC